MGVRLSCCNAAGRPPRRLQPILPRHDTVSSPSFASNAARTAETLRLVLPLMSAHGADCSPQSYALWYAYVTGGCDELKAALDKVVAARARLSDDDTQRLFGALVLSGEGKALDLVRQALLRLVGGVSSAASDTRRSSERFITQIEDIADAAERSETTTAVSRLVGHAREMTDSLVSLNSRLADSHAQIEALRDELEHVRQESMTDPLTRLANRSAFDETLGGLAARGAGSEPFSLLMLDVDHFKRINDDLGHLFGDRVLRLIAGVLTKNLKGKDLPARYGGEEFAVLLPDTPPQAAYRVAEQLREAVAAIIVRRGKGEADLQVTLSCGVATHAHGERPDALIERADVALYKAKRRGRNCSVVAGG